jgi:NADH-quinone oxidoreductase subunit E
MLSESEKQEIEEELRHYEQRAGAAIDALRIVQRHRRWVSDESIRDLAEFLGMTPEELDSVATFYNLIFRKPVGEHVIFLCDTVSCWIMGYERLRAHLQARLGISPGETTADGRFTLLPIPCLGTCDHAPAMMVGEELYRDLDPDALDRILERYTARREGDGATAHPEHPAG